MNGRFYFLKIRHLLYLQRLTRVYNLSLQFVNYKTNAVGHILAQMIADWRTLLVHFLQRRIVRQVDAMCQDFCRSLVKNLSLRNRVHQFVAEGVQFEVTFVRSLWISKNRSASSVQVPRIRATRTLSKVWVRLFLTLVKWIWLFSSFSFIPDDCGR